MLLQESRSLVKIVFFLGFSIVFVLYINGFFRETHTEQKKAFMTAVESKMKNNESIEFSFGKLFDFDWQQACFSHRYWYLPWHWDENKKVLMVIQFLDDNKNKWTIEFDKAELNMREDYALGSPAEKCFDKLQQVRLQRVNTSKESFLYLSVVNK